MRSAATSFRPHPPSARRLVKENEPGLYAVHTGILQSKDYLVYRLTGHMETTDMSDASHGLLMNLETRQYDTEMFHNVGVGSG